MDPTPAAEAAAADPQDPTPAAEAAAADPQDPAAAEEPPSPKREGRRDALTAAERDHLVSLGMVAGTMTIMEEAMRSGDVFDPAHMQRARAIGEEMDRRILRGLGRARARSTVD